MRATLRIYDSLDGRTTGDLIYFARRIDTGLIKIGTTKDIRHRLEALVRETKSEVTCLGVLPGGVKKEAETHLDFSDFSLGHEWFLPAPALLAFISRETMRPEFRRSSWKNVCQGKTKYGVQCNAPALLNNKFCQHHSKQ